VDGRLPLLLELPLRLLVAGTAASFALDRAEIWRCCCSMMACALTKRRRTPSARKMEVRAAPPRCRAVSDYSRRGGAGCAGQIRLTAVQT
jgi:hypothetical protein